MFCLSDSSTLSSCKVINDAAATYSLLPTTNSDYIIFDIMTPNYSLLSRCWTMTVQRWSETFVEHGRSGHGWLYCWAGRVRMPGLWAIFTWRWFSWSCCTVRICGWWHPVLGGLWVDYTAEWPIGWRGGNLGEEGTAHGSTSHWSTRSQRWYCRRWRPMSPSTRT